MMLNRIAAKRAAMRWKREHGGAFWPAEHIFARDDGCKDGTQKIRLGYIAERGEFICVVDMRFADTHAPVYVSDRRRHNYRWPPEMQRIKVAQARA